MGFSRVLLAGALLATTACTESTGTPVGTPTATGPTVTDIPDSRTPTESPTPVTVDVAQALLQRGHLGRRFAPMSAEDPSFHTVYDDPEGRFGCLRALDEVTFGVLAGDSAAAVFDARNAAMSPHIVSLVGAAETEEAAAAGFAEAGDILDTCRRVRSRTAESRVDGRVETTRAPILPAVDEQLDIRVTGRLRVLASAFPLGSWVSVFRIDRYVAIVSVLDLGHDGAQPQQELTKAVALRLRALVAAGPLPRVRLVQMGTRLPD